MLPTLYYFRQYISYCQSPIERGHKCGHTHVQMRAPLPLLGYVSTCTFAALAARHVDMVHGFMITNGVSLLAVRRQVRYDSATTKIPHAWQHAQGTKASTATPRMFFGGSSGSMPKLYDGWFKKTGQIQKDIVAGVKGALRCERYVQIRRQQGSKSPRVISINLDS